MDRQIDRRTDGQSLSNNPCPVLVFDYGTLKKREEENTVIKRVEQKYILDK